MKFIYETGWYSISTSGTKYCVTYSLDGSKCWVEDLPLSDARTYGEAVEYCKNKIRPVLRPVPEDQENADPPECKKECRYRQIYRGLALQKNALRCELASMIVPERCGWNILPGRIGGDPLDYAPCYFK